MSNLEIFSDIVIFLDSATHRRRNKKMAKGKSKEKRGLNKKTTDMRGRHSKNNSSQNKSSKNYKKPYNRQGR